MATELSANRVYFHRAFATPIRARWDYFSADHACEDMLTAKYFRTVMADLAPGDLILVVDRNENEMQLRVQYVDLELNEVGIAIDRMIPYEPASDGYQIRHAGGRGRGSRYQIVGRDGEIIADNLAGKKTAERELEALLPSAAA